MPNTRKPRARQVLDQIRELLGMVMPCCACLSCGAAMERPQSHPEECPLCGGKQVRAENAVRAIAELAHLKPRATGLGRGWGQENHEGKDISAGALEPVTPLRGRNALR